MSTDTNIITEIVEVEATIIINGFPALEERMRERLSAFNLDLTTDDDFNQADSDAKDIAAGEAALKSMKDHALRSMKNVYDLFEQIDALTGDLSSARLDLTKQIAKRKEERKAEIVEAALATFDIDASIARKTYLSGLQAAIKGKRTVESMETACRIFASTQQAQIVKCCGILDSFEKAHGVEMILDRRELEVSNPDALEAELRRRFEAKKAADEKRRLEAEAAEAKAEADKLKAEAAKGETPPPVDKRNPHNLPDPPRIGSISVGRAVPPLVLHAEATEDEEWAEMKKTVIAAFGMIKDHRERLTHERNRERITAFGSGVNALWKEINSKEVAS